jgi:VCBS repeat-containing protein
MPTEATVYTLNNGLSAVQGLSAGQTLTETFSYTMTDSDGDHSSATLTLTITGSNDSASVVTAHAEGPDATVFEHGLTSGGDTSETTSGTFSVAASDGILNVVIGGTTFTLAQVQAFNGTQTVNTGEGVLTLTGYSGNSFGGTISYSYTLSATIDNDSKVPRATTRSA